jgi:hypothetical protein
MKLIVSKIGNPTSNNNRIATLKYEQTVEGLMGVQKTVTRNFNYAFPADQADKVQVGAEVEINKATHQIIERSNTVFDEETGEERELTSYWIHERVGA